MYLSIPSLSLRQSAVGDGGGIFHTIETKKFSPSPMSGSIYFPATNQIASDLHVTLTQINITVTTYLVSPGHSLS